MFEKVKEKFESRLFTFTGGLFLIGSFIFNKSNVNLPVDLAWVTVIVSGLPIIYSAIKKLVENKGVSKISSALLISIAMTASVLIGDLFAAGEVAFIMAIGEILEDTTTNRAKKGLHKLISIVPIEARIIDGTEEKTVLLKDVKCGDVLRVLPGEKFPVDAVILSGETTVDQSVITGESLPIEKSAGDEVYSGTVNCFGSVDIKAVKVGEDSSLQRIIKLVQNAEENKAPMARTADRAASYLVPLALIIAVITGIITEDIIRAVTVLVVFCPCALVLATPTAIMAAIGQATKHGVIIKSGDALEKLGNANVIAFDKTGTLTCGKLVVSDVVSVNPDKTEADILEISAVIESKSEHPIGKAIYNFAKEKALKLSEPIDFKMNVGRGVSGKKDSKTVFCGNESFIIENKIPFEENAKLICEKFKKEGKAPVIVAEDNTVLGVIALSDVIRDDAPLMVEKLNRINTEAILLTGDNALTAEYFAERSNIKKVFSDLLPEDKVENIVKLQQEGKTVCMIGDGVNDAPALKTADIGIAMGSMGSDIAVEAADIALMNDDISKITYLKRLSLATVNTIKLSIALSMIINIIAVILSVLGVLNPTTGALVHNVGSCFVVFTAGLLYDRRFK